MGVAELAYASSSNLEFLWVRIPPPVPTEVPHVQTHQEAPHPNRPRPGLPLHAHGRDVPPEGTEGHGYGPGARA